MISKRAKVAALFVVFALSVGAAVLFTARFFLPPEAAWRLAVLQAKATGQLNQIPVRNLVAWLSPGSPVYLAPLAENPNPHLAIRNILISAEDAKKGKALYAKHCGQCHGDAGRGNSALSLLEPVSVKSDWSFFSAVKWGLPGTSMPALPLSDAEVWFVHAYMREESLAAAGQASTTKTGAAARVSVKVDSLDILGADKRLGQWLTYAGNYLGHRHTLLSGVTKGNVQHLQLAWSAQLRQVDRELQASPIVAGGLMFVSESREGVTALDAKTGDEVWTYRRPVPDNLPLCCGMPNRGVAILGQTVFVATIDGFLVALDANTGKQRWISKVADYRDGFTLTGAPLALPDRIVVGVAGGEFGIRGFLAAYDPADGRELWKFYTVPGPGEPGNDTWPGDSWKTGGVPTWTVGAYDPEQDLVFWGTGNPGPVFQADVRRGDNLYSNSVVAVEGKTGRLKWYFQFTPNDDHDWDAVQQPVLGEIEWQGKSRPVVLWPNRNAFFYALDRRTGEFLFAKPFVKQTWNGGFDAKGRPQVLDSARPTKTGTLAWPAIMAATNWWPPSYDPSRQLVFVPTSDAASVYFKTDEIRFEKGKRFEGSTASFYNPNVPATAYVKAIDALTGDVRWEAVLESSSTNFVWTVGGILSTKTGVVFAGYRNYFHAFDADTGKELWKVNLGARVRGSPVSYSVDGQQFIAVPAGHSVFAFRIPGP